MRNYDHFGRGWGWGWGWGWVNSHEFQYSKRHATASYSTSSFAFKIHQCHLYQIWFRCQNLGVKLITLIDLTSNFHWQHSLVWTLPNISTLSPGFVWFLARYDTFTREFCCSLACMPFTRSSACVVSPHSGHVSVSHTLQMTMCWHGGDTWQAWRIWQIWQRPCTSARTGTTMMRSSIFIFLVHSGHFSASHTLQMTMWLQGGNTQQARRTRQIWQLRCSCNISNCVIISNNSVEGMQKTISCLLCFSTIRYPQSVIKQSCRIMSH